MAIVWWEACLAVRHVFAQVPATIHSQSHSHQHTQGNKTVGNSTASNRTQSNEPSPCHRNNSVLLTVPQPHTPSVQCNVRHIKAPWFLQVQLQVAVPTCHTVPQALSQPKQQLVLIARRLVSHLTHKHGHNHSAAHSTTHSATHSTTHSATHSTTHSRAYNHAHTYHVNVVQQLGVHL